MLYARCLNGARPGQQADGLRLDSAKEMLTASGTTLGRKVYTVLKVSAPVGPVRGDTASEQLMLHERPWGERSTLAPLYICRLHGQLQVAHREGAVTASIQEMSFADEMPGQARHSMEDERCIIVQGQHQVDLAPPSDGHKLAGRKSSVALVWEETGNSSRGVFAGEQVVHNVRLLRKVWDQLNLRVHVQGDYVDLQGVREIPGALREQRAAMMVANAKEGTNDGLLQDQNSLAA